MKNVIILLFVSSFLFSCSGFKNTEENKNTKIQTWWVNISTWKVNIETGIVEDKVQIDVNKIDNNDEEKDIVIVKDNDEENDDFDWKTQEEVVNEMSDYVNDLFNMIEEDVK